MKRIVAFLFLISLAFLSWGYEVGDLYIDPNTGVPSIVVYVDNTGEHGMIMSPAGGYRTEKQIQKDIKSVRHTMRLESRYKKIQQAEAMKHGIDVALLDECLEQARTTCETVLEWLPNMPFTHLSKITEKQERDMLRNIASQMTGYGAKDQQMIIDYCKANNINLQEYFYLIDWALKLGEGWFIPGNYDLELYSHAFSPGLGIVRKYNEMTQESATWAWKKWMLANVYPTAPIRSSTFLESSWEETDNNKGKTATIIRTNTIDLNFKDNYYVFGVGNNYGKSFYAMIKNDQTNSYCVAFKYF